MNVYDIVGGDKIMPRKIGKLVGMKADVRICHGMISFMSACSLDAINILILLYSLKAV